MTLPVVADALASAAQGAVFIAIGSRLFLRPVWSGDRLAVQAFAGWWFLFGIQSLVTSIRLAAVAGGATDADLYMVALSVEVVLAFLALGGLLLYAVYIWRGRYLSPAAVFGGLAGLGFLYVVLLQWHDPTAVVVDGYQTDIEFGRHLGVALRWTLLLGYYLPVLGIGALFAYVGTVSQRPQKDRAYGVAAVVSLLAVGHAFALAPVELGGWGFLQPLLRMGAAAVAAGVFLWKR